MIVRKNVKNTFIFYFLPLLLIISSLNSCKEKGNGDWQEGLKVATEVENPDDDFLLSLTTKYGVMKIVLFKETPIHRANFIKLVRQHYYDSLLFHRVVKGFMIQGGDPESRFAEPNTSLGKGEIGDKLPAEINYKYFHRKGALAMARQGNNVNPEKESSGCQFYIVQGRKYTKEGLLDKRTDYKKVNEYFMSLMEDPEYSRIASAYAQLGERGDAAGQKRLMKKCIPLMEKKYDVKLLEVPTRKERLAYTSVGGTPFLDREYTVFGQVVEGMNIIDSIANEKVNRQKRPINDVKMSITVEEVPSIFIDQYIKTNHL